MAASSLIIRGMTPLSPTESSGGVLVCVFVVMILQGAGAIARFVGWLSGVPGLSSAPPRAPGDFWIMVSAYVNDGAELLVSTVARDRLYRAFGVLLAMPGAPWEDPDRRVVEDALFKRIDGLRRGRRLLALRNALECAARATPCCGALAAVTPHRRDEQGRVGGDRAPLGDDDHARLEVRLSRDSASLRTTDPAARVDTASQPLRVSYPLWRTICGVVSPNWRT